MRRNLISIIILCFIFQGCSIQYHSRKKFDGTGKDIQTKMGTIKGANFEYEGTLDVVLGSIIKKEPIPLSNLDFINP